jgi:purine-binding chemotaxis protein CheW
MPADIVSEQQNWVAFRLHQQIYALPIEAIVQVISMVTITPIPRSHPVIMGIINLRGAAVPVISLHRFLGLPEPRLQVHTPLILIRFGAQVIGVIADEVLDVIQFGLEQIIHPQEILPEGLKDIPNLHGIVYFQQRVVLLIELEQLFISERGRGLAEAVQLAPLIAAELESQKQLNATPLPDKTPEVALPGRISPETDLVGT